MRDAPFELIPIGLTFPFVMLNSFQHLLGLWRMDPEPKASVAKQVQGDEGKKGAGWRDGNSLAAPSPV